MNDNLSFVIITNLHSIMEQTPPATHPLPLDSLLSCDESADHYLHEVELKIGEAEDELGNSSTMRVRVRKWRSEEQWEISRKYEDCQWLFKSLKNRFPGALLPYFPAIAVQEYLENKAKILNIKLHQHFYAPRLQELSNFLSVICGSHKWGKAEEVQIFLLKGEEFQRRKDQIARLVQEARLSSKTFSIYSFFSRSIAWLSNKEEKSDPGNNLLRLRCHLNTYSTQISFLLQKFAEIISLKAAENGWSGASTQIDSYQRLTAKIASSRPFNQKLINEIERKVLVPLVEALKKEAQIQQQLDDRTEAGKLLEYLRSAGEAEQKISRFAQHIAHFDSTMLEEWSGFEEEWKVTVGEIDIKFRAIWTDYSESMGKIWK